MELDEIEEAKDSEPPEKTGVRLFVRGGCLRKEECDGRPRVPKRAGIREYTSSYNINYINYLHC